MKYLFHRDESSYDSNTKQFIFTCTDNLHNPTRLVLDDVVFKASTMTPNTAYPQTIYLRSDALTDMIQTNHTQEVKTDGTKRRSNIIAVLNQYMLGRYELRQTRQHRFKIDKHRVNKVFDFSFTDNLSPLGDYVGGVTDADILALQNSNEITFIVDMNEPGDVINTSSQNASVGDNISQIHDKHTGLITYATGYGSILYTDLNANMRGITGDPSTSWEYMTESSSANNPPHGTHGGITFCIKVSDPRENLEVLHKVGVMQIYIYGSVLQMNVGGGYNVISGTMEPGRVYIVQCWWDATIGGPPPWAFAWYTRVWDTVTSTMSSTTIISTTISSAAPKNYYISTAQSHIKSILGDFALHKNTESTRDTLVEFYKQHLDGTSPDPNAVDAEFQITLEIK
jgi:hypothetical protein